MDGLDINTIPSNLLLRILLQLCFIPSHKDLDLVSILHTALQQLGQTSDLDAFLDYCQVLSNPKTPCVWNSFTIKDNNDWESANNKKPQDLAGIRFLMASETARQNIELTRYSKAMLYDPKCIHFFQGKAIPVNDLLHDTLLYFKQEKHDVDPLMETLINLRLDKYEHDKLEFERQTEELDDADYHLLGALMVRYDSTASRGSASRSWCLYLRDYIEDEDGSTWRILLEDGESRVVSDQTLADIRGARENKTSPSEFSRDYRPVYLFYGNLDISQTSQMDDQNGNNVITLEDYTFDDEYDQDQLLLPQGAREEEEACKHCGIKDIVEDINDIFFCESCNQGVHQLCEEPPVEAFEKDVDPWYCRSCCKAQNIPVPSLPQLRDAAIYDENILKRKRKEDHTTCEDAGSLEKKT